MDPETKYALQRGAYIGAAIRRWESEYGSTENKPITRSVLEISFGAEFDRTQAVRELDLAIAKFGGIYGRAPRDNELKALKNFGLKSILLNMPVNPCPNQEKKPMRSINLACLVALAAVASEPEDDFEFDGALGDAFKEAEAEAAKEAKSAAVGTIKELMRRSEQQKTHLRTELRSIRQMERRTKNKLADLDRAKAYAVETSNFIPWAALLGFTSYDCGCNSEEFARLSKVPADWSPKPKDIASE